MPMETSSGRTSVSSTGRRPPPSKSHTANTIGGDGEYASESTVKVATVAGTSAIGAGSMSSTVAARRSDTRAGGRCSASVLTVPRTDEAVLPVEAPLGSRCRHPRRLGPVRAAAIGSTPRHDRYLAYGERVVAAAELVGDAGGAPVATGDRLGDPEHEHVGAVGHRHQGDDLAGLGRLEQRGEQQRPGARRR